MELFSFRKIQSRIVLFISGIAVIFLVAVLFIRQTEISNVDKIINNRKAGKASQLDKIIDVLGKPFEAFTDNYLGNAKTNSIIQFDTTWSQSNFRVSNTSDIQFIWIYNKDLKRVYLATMFKDSISNNFSIDNDNVIKLFKRNQFFHYFVFTPKGLLEVRGAPIRKAGGGKPGNSYEGYIFSGFIWSDKFLKELAELTFSRDVEIIGTDPNSKDAFKYKASDNENLVVISTAKNLYGWDGNIIAKVLINSELPISIESVKLFNKQFFILFGFSFVILMVISIFLFHYVSNPLKYITKSLENEDMELLEKVNTTDKEFKVLTNLLKTFFQQKRQFEIEIKNRAKVEKEIKQLNEVLEQRVLERTAQLEATNIQLVKDIEERKLLLEELTISKEKAEESDNLKSVFLANMSHEIRTPLNAMLGFASFFKNGKLSEERRNKYTAIIDESGNQLLSLINDIIDVSKIEAGQVKINFTALDLNKKMKLLTDLFLNDLQQKEKKKVKLKLTLPDKKLDQLILLDDYRLNQVLINLVGNAIKFTSEGTIEFGYDLLANQSILFFVKDEGIGIPKDKQKIIFDRFRQAQDSSIRRYGGTGLGLTISKSLVELMGGKIWVESEEDKGAHFYFTIPLKLVDAKF